MKRTLKPKVEYRICCAAFGLDATHREHAYSKGDREKAEKAAAKNNVDPVLLDPVPAHRGCLPYRVEARVVTPWEIPGGAVELAEMLIADWWAWA